MSIFGERLGELRGGRSKAEYARFLELRSQSYQRYEAGRIPNIDILCRIGTQCGVTLDWLLGQSDDKALPTNRLASSEGQIAKEFTLSDAICVIAEQMNMDEDEVLRSIMDKKLEGDNE